MKIIIAAASLCVALAACTAQQQQTACANFKTAEANPLVQLAVAGATTAINVETAGAGGAAVGIIKSFGDNYCAAGAPPGDTTTPEQQASWLAGVTAQMLSAAGAK